MEQKPYVPGYKSVLAVAVIAILSALTDNLLSFLIIFLPVLGGYAVYRFVLKTMLDVPINPRSMTFYTILHFMVGVACYLVEYLVISPEPSLAFSLGFVMTLESFGISYWAFVVFTDGPKKWLSGERLGWKRSRK
jgi:hypothetical protein